MKPYYQDDYCTIYHGDCRDILPLLPKADLVLTDPPYGIDVDTNYSRFGVGVVKGKDYAKVISDKEVMDLRFLFSFGKIQVVFGANNFPEQIPFDCKRDGWICWDKRIDEQADKMLGSPFEMACVIGRRLYRIIRLRHAGVVNADGPNSRRVHPTQKPVRLFSLILNMIDCVSILDPFMGSGTTLRAAKDLRRKCIGIEIEEKYCEIAARRVARGENEEHIKVGNKKCKQHLGFGL